MCEDKIAKLQSAINDANYEHSAFPLWTYSEFKLYIHISCHKLVSYDSCLCCVLNKFILKYYICLTFIQLHQLQDIGFLFQNWSTCYKICHSVLELVKGFRLSCNICMYQSNVHFGYDITYTFFLHLHSNPLMLPLILIGKLP